MQQRCDVTALSRSIEPADVCLADVDMGLSCPSSTCTMDGRTNGCRLVHDNDDDDDDGDGHALATSVPSLRSRNR